jgi:hypothetical protein
VGNMLAVLDTDLVMKVDLCTLTADMEDAEQGQASNLKVAIPGRGCSQREFPHTHTREF